MAVFVPMPNKGKSCFENSNNKFAGGHNGMEKTGDSGAQLLSNLEGNRTRQPSKTVPLSCVRPLAWSFKYLVRHLVFRPLE